MAQEPGRFEYTLDGQSVYFVNENDNKIIIRSEAPVVTINDSGIVRPLSASLSLSGQDPKPIGIIEPSTASLTFTGTVPVFDKPILVSLGTLALSGKVPELSYLVPFVTSVNVAITGQNVERSTGLKLEGQAPTAVGGSATTVPVGSLSLASTAPDVFPEDTGVPRTQSVTLSGNAPTTVVANTTLPGTDALVIQGRLTSIFDEAYPGKDALNITGYAPVLARSEGQVTVLIEGPFEYGTFIRNATATTDVPVNYQIDDRTGFKVKVKDVLIEEYTGSLVRPESLDKRSEQEFLRSRSDGGKGPKRPEPVGNERHIDEEFPDGVSADDL